MSVSGETKQDSSLAGRLARQWRDWRWRRRAITELSCCEARDRERIAHDIGISGADLCILAGKWPDDSALLSQRLQQLDLNAANTAEVEPQVLWDLQRVCTLCLSKRKCKHDLAAHSADPVWQDYCPNAPTLRALMAERCRRNTAQAG